MLKTNKEARAINLDDLLVQNPPAPLTLEEYMPQEWLGDEDEREVHFLCNMIVVNIDFQERNIQIRHDHWIRNHTIVVSHHQIVVEAQIVEVRGLDWKNKHIDMTTRLMYTYKIGLSSQIFWGIPDPTFHTLH